MKTEIKSNVEQIANRANELTGSMSHGHACYAAALEFDASAGDVALVAGIVSTILTDRETAFRLANAPTPAQHAAALADEAAIQDLSQQLGLGSQSRQGVRRRLRKHGLTSTYAATLRARILSTPATTPYECPQLDDDGMVDDKYTQL